MNLLFGNAKPVTILESIADDPGLDVTHVGIIIKNKGKVYLRHASSLPEYGRSLTRISRPTWLANPVFWFSEH